MIVKLVFTSLQLELCFMFILKLYYFKVEGVNSVSFLYIIFVIKFRIYFPGNSFCSFIESDRLRDGTVTYSLALVGGCTTRVKTLEIEL